MKKIKLLAAAISISCAIVNAAHGEPLTVPPHTEVLGFHLGMSDCNAATVELSRTHREMSQTLSAELPPTYYLVNVNGSGFGLPGLNGVSLICARSRDRLIHGAALVFSESAVSDVLAALYNKYKRVERPDNEIIFEAPEGLIIVELLDSGLRAFYADKSLIGDIADMHNSIGSKL